MRRSKANEVVVRWGGVETKRNRESPSIKTEYAVQEKYQNPKLSAKDQRKCESKKKNTKRQLTRAETD